MAFPYRIIPVSYANLRETMPLERLAPYFNFNVVVQFVRCVSVAVEAHVTSLHALRINQFAFIGLDVIQVFADTKAKFVGVIIVENGCHAVSKGWVIGDLYYDIAIYARLRMEMPDENCVDVGSLCQINLHPLLARSKLDP